MKTKPIPVRIPEELIELAKQKGLNVAEIMRQALEDAVKKKRCPTCGQLVKK